MAINDLPILSALRTKMQWHQERQRVLAENVSNANTPNFRPSDLVEPKFDNKGANVGGAMGSLGMMRTASHPYRRFRRRTKLQGRRRQERLFDQAGRQCGQSGRPDAEGFGQPDGLRRGDFALQPQPRTSQNRHRKTLTRKGAGSWQMMEAISPAR